METSGSCSSGSAPDERALRALTVDAPLANAPLAEGSAHTPGPWFVDQWRADDNFAIRQDGSGTIAETPGWIPEHKDEERANARLIAAAPELLEALIELHEAETAPFPSFEAASIESQSAWSERRGSARERALAAIAKATGGSQ